MIMYVFLMVLAEFFIIMDAGVIGYLMNGGYSLNWIEVMVFLDLLVLGICFRYIAEKNKR